MKTKRPCKTLRLFVTHYLSIYREGAESKRDRKSNTEAEKEEKTEKREKEKERKGESAF